MAQSDEHSKLVNEIMLAIGSRHDCLVWKNATGMARAMDNPSRKIKFGLPGSSDIIGLLDDGTFLAIEVKTGGATQTDKQKAFQRVIEGMNGIYIIARSVDEVEDFLDGKGKVIYI